MVNKSKGVSPARLSNCLRHFGQPHGVAQKANAIRCYKRKVHFLHQPNN